jgi:RNA polymerase sigma-70 factor (ECF subfamily)
MIGRSPELPHLGLQRPPVTETSVNCLPLTVVKGRFRVQFTAFDADYLERLRQGDAATERHFATYFGDLIRLKLRPRLSAADAIDDVSQETFARVLAMVRNKDGVRQPERLGALVNSVCNHVLQEHYRSKRRIHESIDDESESAPVDRGNSVSGIHEIDETERVCWMSATRTRSVGNSG